MTTHTTPLLYVCPEEPNNHENTAYAAGVTTTGNTFVAVVDAEKAVELIGGSRHSMDDGSLLYANLDEEDYDALFVEQEVTDAELDELSTHPF